MSKKCYGIGVIGTGVIWEKGHLPALQSMPGEAVVRYVYDIDAECAERAARETGAKALLNPEKMFESRDIDIITIATPPFARVDYVEKACKAGKHLMVEKPMSRTLEQAHQIFNDVRDSGVKCFIPFARACSSAMRKAVHIIQSGELGDPVAFVHVNLSSPYGWVPLNHWMHDMKKSGGPIFDFSIHYIELARACMGVEVESVLYGGANTTGRVKSDDLAALLVSYQGGGYASFTKSWAFPPDVPVGHSSNHIACREGAVTITSGIEVHTKDGVRKIENDPPGPASRIETYRNLIAAIENNTPLYASELEGLRTIEILTAGLRSRDSGHVEKVSRMTAVSEQ